MPLSLITLFIKSLLIGFVIAIPPGPVGVLCIRTTLSKKWCKSLVMGAGAASADTFYAAIAGLSLGNFTSLIETSSYYFQLFGALFVAWLGVSIIRAPVTPPTAQEKSDLSFAGGWVTAFFITLSNPLTLIAFAASFTSLGVVLERTLMDGLFLLSGVFLGAMLWWTSLTILTHRLRY